MARRWIASGMGLFARPAVWRPLGIIAGLVIVILLGSWPVFANPLGTTPPSSAAITWNRTLNLAWVIEHAIDLLLPLWVLFSGWWKRLAASLERAFKGRQSPSLIALGIVFLAIRFVLRLPVEYARHAAYPGKFPDSTTEWLGGQFQSLIVPLVAIIVLLWLPYWLMRCSPRRWWLWLTVIAAPVALFVLIVQPIWMATMAGGYQDLQDKALNARIVAMAEQCGVKGIHVVVGGDDTTVVGLGPTNRVILESDLFKTETPDQIRFTVAHELKHYVMGDNWKALGIVVLFVLLASLMIDQVGRRVVRRYSTRIGFDTLSNARSLPLVFLCVAVFWLVVSPGFLAFNRHIEREADRFGFELSRENDAAAALFVSWIGDTEMADPGLLARLTRSTHPSIAERVQMAEEYRPWATGAPLRYGSICPVR